MSRGEVNQTQSSDAADVAADDVDTLSGLLEATALIMMSIQDGLAKVRLVYNICLCSDLFTLLSRG